ncbi:MULTISPECIES: hypothetical protein [unclassified Flavobacterium]|uniref:hypothetical protein n=1 Tax=unclassified Flavobacterium TaxID=196869 RepID=UPI000EB535F5|nr:MULTISPECIES: hypothetical protein [unclassified Flavobacterium]RKS02631.1 hypothetical protein C8C84_2355 [Flavobacterium sp. 102]
MKKIVLPLMIVAIGIGLYEQSKAQPNLYIMIVAIVIFMYGMMRLSAKTPSKHSETEEENDN